MKMFNKKETYKKYVPKTNSILSNQETINYMIFGMAVWFAGFLVIGDLFLWG